MGAPRPTYVGGRSGPRSHSQATDAPPIETIQIVFAPQVVVYNELSGFGGRITALLGVLAAVIALVAAVESRSGAQIVSRANVKVAEMQRETARIQLETERLKLPRLSPGPPSATP